MLLDSPQVLAWLFLAHPVGMGASQLMAGGYGMVGNLAVAMLGGLVGGLTAASLRLEGQAWLVASILATAVGAVAATGLARALADRARA